MIVNPLDNSLFLPTAYRFAAILLTILPIILVIARRRLRSLGHDVLFQRWLSWAVIGPLYLCSVLAGEAFLTGLVILATFLGLREYAQLVEIPNRYRTVLLAMGLLAAPVAAFSLEVFALLPPLLLIIATLQPLAFGDLRTGVRHLAFAALGWGYIAWFLAHLILIGEHVQGGSGLLVAMGLGVAMSDVGAFTVGKLLGRHKLLPRVSPNKTWEGVAGNFAGAYLGVALTHYALPDSGFLPLMIALPLVISVGAIWGDLVESAIKREFQAKDAGTWLPGFGGLLDRIDSLLIVAPLTYYVARILS